MRKRHPNYRRVKIHRSYTVEEVATLFGLHKNTVRNWVKNGLSTIDNRRPMLILGYVLVEYLQKRRTKNKKKCKPGQLYCVRCRVPKYPEGGWAEFEPVTDKVGNLKAICPDCDSVINQRVSISNMDQIKEKIEVVYSNAE